MFVKVETGDDSLRQETQHAEIRTRKIMFCYHEVVFKVLSCTAHE